MQRRPGCITSWIIVAYRLHLARSFRDDVIGSSVSRDVYITPKGAPKHELGFMGVSMEKGRFLAGKRRRKVAHQVGGLL